LGNQEQNREFRAAVREIGRVIGRILTLDEVDRLHREISRQHRSFGEIVQIGVAMFG
jgi:hypothetical protein